MLDPKWTGTVIDRREMKTLNLEQVVRRNFGKLAMFGFASTLLSTWESIAISLSIALPNGGTAGLFWNYMIASVGLGFVYASIAEMGSMFPTAGGQYFWVSVLAPRNSRRYLSYITGWLCTITWQTGLAGGSYFAGTMMQGLLVLNQANYVFERWHGTLLVLLFIAMALVFNTFLARKLPLVEVLFVFCHILGVIIFIPLLALAPRREGGSPLVDFFDGGGWSTNGLATMVGATGPIGALIGFDCSVHMTEEAKDASRNVPYTLLAGYTANVLLGFFVLMICIYTIGPLPDALNNATTGYPVINMFYNATRSLAATDIMTTVIIICNLAGAIAALAAASRQLWAFARNCGLPFSSFFAPSHLTYDIPLNSVLFSLILPIAIALINIGSTEGIGIIFSIYNSALISSYIVTIGCILLHRLQGRRLPDARYSLGKYGAWCNSIALIYLAPILVFTFFPSTPNPTASTMNWAIALVGGIILFATIYYVVYGSKQYTPPNETVDDYIKRYAANSASSDKDLSSATREERFGEERVDGEPIVEETVDTSEKLVM